MRVNVRELVCALLTRLLNVPLQNRVELDALHNLGLIQMHNHNRICASQNGTRQSLALKVAQQECE